MSLTLLCAGDVHLGRRPARLPQSLGNWGLAPAELSPDAAFRALVAEALARGVDAVLLAGDVVEADNRFFEAFGPLVDGVRQLTRAGIAVFAVAGNHDVEVLPRLAREVPGFALLGPGGTWSSAVLERPGGAVRLIGWSFPQRHVRRCPLDDLPPAHADGLPTLGLLHCDLDGRDSPYAPVPKALIENSHPHAWLLGHIHAPSFAQAARPLGYLGSLCGLDPSEAGVRGPWLVEVRGAGDLKTSHLPLAPLRWQGVEVPIDGLRSVDDLEGAVVAAIRDLHAGVAPGLGRARAVGCRVRLVGRSALHRQLRAWLASHEPAGLVWPMDGVVYFVADLSDDSAAALDLPRLALGADPPGLLARRLLALEADGPEGRDLVTAARARIRGAAELPTWQALGDAPPGDQEIRMLLLRSGLAALEELLAQAPTGGAA